MAPTFSELAAYLALEQAARESTARAMAALMALDFDFEAFKALVESVVAESAKADQAAAALKAAVLAVSEGSG